MLCPFGALLTLPARSLPAGSLATLVYRQHENMAAGSWPPTNTGVLGNAGVTKTAVIIVGRVLAAEGFRDSHLCSDARERGAQALRDLHGALGFSRLVAAEQVGVLIQPCRGRSSASARRSAPRRRS
jgi:hypothetical protein